jgi:hypothetical protein
MVTIKNTTTNKQDDLSGLIENGGAATIGTGTCTSMLGINGISTQHATIFVYDRTPYIVDHSNQGSWYRTGDETDMEDGDETDMEEVPSILTNGDGEKIVDRLKQKERIGSLIKELTEGLPAARAAISERALRVTDGIELYLGPCKFIVQTGKPYTTQYESNQT